MWQQLLDMELSQDAGTSLDILIVCNGGCYRFLKKYDGMTTKNGKIIVSKRKNTGGAFGGYSHAFQNFNYDYYIFTEDDLFIFGDEYGKKMIRRYEEKGCGFMALIGLSENPTFPIHAHGAVGMARRNVLESIADKKGELPYFHGGWQRANVILYGEIGFSQTVLSTGFTLDEYGSKSWDINNLILPYYDVRQS